jgi:succinylglutamic semialdehyde dehydrogenase
MGSLISRESADQLLTTQNRLCLLGAAPLLPITRLEEKTGLVSPGLLDVTNVEDLPDKEYFGPLLCLIRYDDFEQALRIANNTRFGLSAALYSDDPGRWRRFRQQIRAGIVNWNRPTTGASGSAPFGGIGDSGNLRPSAYYAADYCAHPVTSMEAETPFMPDHLSPGLESGNL